MADEDDDAFTFGDFKFASPQSQPFPTLNGDVLPNFFFSNPSGSLNANPVNVKPGSDPFSIQSDPGPNPLQKPRGAIPLSLFGEVEPQVEEKNDLENGKFGVKSNSNGVGFNNFDDVFGKLYVHNPQINGSDLNFDGSGSNLNNIEVDEEEDDEWEFKGADLINGFMGNNNLGEKGNSLSYGSKVEPVVDMNREKQAGQDASISIGYEHGPSNSLPQIIDLFAAHNGDVDKSGEMDLGFNFNSTTVTSNGFTWGSFPELKEIGNGNGMSTNSVNEDDDFDDFGDFVDASQEVQPGGQEQVPPQMKTSEEQFQNETIQAKQTKQESNGGALPLSLFSDLTEESSDTLKYEDNLIQKPVSYPVNGFISQGSGVSIHDLISNLYSQAQQTSSVVPSDQKPAENGVHFSSEKLDSTSPTEDDDWDDSSWEFKDAFSETGFREQSSSHTFRNVSQKPSETSSNIQFYMEFYATLREALCFLLSHQLKEEEEARCSGSAIDYDGKVESSGNDTQEAYKLVQDSMIDKEAFSKKHLETSTCLNEVLEALQDPKLQVIESEYSLSKRLQLAANEWRVASELLRHVISVVHILSLGSSDDHKVYVSTWSKLINVCNEELKYGALIWKRASEKNLQHQILSDHRGQRYIQALGEIYKVVELLALSVKLYLPWMLLSVSSNLSGPLDECHTLWSSSGLEQALQDISDNVDFGCYEPSKALIASIKNIRNLDMVAVHDLVFVQQKSLCRLSLLPLEMLADLKMVLWNEEPYFVNLANLWANLISTNPPELPNLQVSQEIGHDK